MVIPSKLVHNDEQDGVSIRGEDKALMKNRGGLVGSWDLGDCAFCSLP